MPNEFCTVCMYSMSYYWRLIIWFVLCTLTGRENVSLSVLAGGGISRANKAQKHTSDLCRLTMDDSSSFSNVQNAGNNNGNSTIDRSLPIHDALESLYFCTSYTVNQLGGNEMDQLLHALQAPANQSLFVIQHILKLHIKGNQVSTLEQGLSHCSHLLKSGYIFLVPLEVPTQQPINDRLLQPGIFFEVTESNKDVSTGWKKVDQFHSSSRKMVHEILEASKVTPYQESLIQDRLQEFHTHLRFTLGTDLRDRAASDAAFTLSIAGIAGNCELFNILAHVSALELQRKSIRSSRKASDILYVVEKIAASGIQRRYAQLCYDIATDSLLDSKGYSDLCESSTIQDLQESRFRISSPRASLWVFRRFTSVYPRITDADIKSSLNLSALSDKVHFDDPSRPLVVDIGCGIGLSLVELANYTFRHPAQEPLDTFPWAECNFFGGDVNPNAIRWANAISSRWNNVNGRVQFCHVTAQTMLEHLIDHCQYPISLLVLQFPTPYRVIEDKEDGNCYLPKSSEDEQFMANESMLQSMVTLLQKQDGKSYLLVQSNCEDVALFIHDKLSSMGLIAVESAAPIQTLEDIHGTETARTKTWLEQQQGNQIKRAIGKVWSSKPYLPAALTETEVAMESAGTPVHRCLFQNVTNRM